MIGDEFGLNSVPNIEEQKLTGSDPIELLSEVLRSATWERGMSFVCKASLTGERVEAIFAEDMMKHDEIDQVRRKTGENF